jgi:hypothetical protein
MMHVVLERLENGVDRIKSSGMELRPERFPAFAGELDVNDEGMMDALRVSYERLFVEMPEAIEGCVYEEGGCVHVAAWQCAERVTWGTRLGSIATAGGRYSLRNVPVALLALIVLAWLTPSPIMLVWQLEAHHSINAHFEEERERSPSAEPAHGPEAKQPKHRVIEV